VDGFAVILAVLGSLHGLIHLGVSFPAHIKGFYITPLHQVRMCFCARWDLCQVGF